MDRGLTATAPAPGWQRARDGSWHPTQLVDVRCPRCGLEGGAPEGTLDTVCPQCRTHLRVLPAWPTSPSTDAPATYRPPPPAPPPPPPLAKELRRRTEPSWAATAMACVVAAAVVVVGAVDGRPGAHPELVEMHFCTGGSAPTVDVGIKIGRLVSNLRAIPNGHCATDQRFVAGAGLEVDVHNTTGVGEVSCTIFRSGRAVDSDESTLRNRPARCAATA